MNAPRSTSSSAGRHAQVGLAARYRRVLKAFARTDERRLNAHNPARVQHNQV
jgi:hypothetical protein